MEKAIRRRYTLEYKQEALRLVTSGQKGIGSGEGSGHRRAEAGELGEGGQAGSVAWFVGRAVERGAHGGHPAAGGAGAGNHGARHPPPHGRRPVRGDPGLGKAMAYFAKVRQ